MKGRPRGRRIGPKAHGAAGFLLVQILLACVGHRHRRLLPSPVSTASARPQPHVAGRDSSSSSIAMAAPAAPAAAAVASSAATSAVRRAV